IDNGNDVVRGYGDEFFGAQRAEFRELVLNLVAASFTMHLAVHSEKVVESLAKRHVRFGGLARCSFNSKCAFTGSLQGHLRKAADCDAPIVFLDEERAGARAYADAEGGKLAVPEFS